jgi:hypothetical protein
VLKISGIVVLLGGLQSWGFNRLTEPLIDTAKQQLSLLQQEAPSHTLLNATLNSLHDYWRLSDNALRQRQILELRDAFLQRFQDAPGLVIEEAVNVTNGFDANTEIETELLVTLRQQLARLQQIYTDHYALAIAKYSKAPLLTQPTAALLLTGRSRMQQLNFNHGLYLMLVGDRSAANSIFTELRLNTRSREFDSRLLYAQARLQYDAFQVEPDLEYFLQAVQATQQSLQADAAYVLPKLFLEYLLTIEQQAVTVESTDEEGGGAGESQGERGAISTGSKEY